MTCMLYVKEIFYSFTTPISIFRTSALFLRNFPHPCQLVDTELWPARLDLDRWKKTVCVCTEQLRQALFYSTILGFLGASFLASTNFTDDRASLGD